MVGHSNITLSEILFWFLKAHQDSFERNLNSLSYTLLTAAADHHATSDEFIVSKVITCKENMKKKKKKKEKMKLRLMELLVPSRIRS